MKKIFLLVVLLLGIFTRVNAYGSANQKAIDVSMINLIASPEKYHDKLIRVIGVGQIEFEGNSIYLSKDDLKFRVSKNAIWISFDLEALGTKMQELQKWNGKYIILEGIFDNEMNGHMGLFSGSIKNITRYNLWETEE